MTEQPDTPSVPERPGPATQQPVGQPAGPLGWPGPERPATSPLGWPGGTDRAAPLSS